MASEGHQEMLEQAYGDLEYRVEEVHDNLSVPTSTPARFEYLETPLTTDADKILERFEESPLTLIDKLCENGERWHEFHVTAQVWTQHEERARLKVSTGGVDVLKRRQELSYESFVEIVEAVEWALGTDLGYVGSGPDE